MEKEVYKAKDGGKLPNSEPIYVFYFSLTYSQNYLFPYMLFLHISEFKQIYKRYKVNLLQFFQ